MTNDRLLITGASGVMGWHLCRYFLERGHSVEGTYRKNKPPLDGIRFYQFALEDPYEVRQLCRGCEYKAVIHTAAMTHPDECEVKPERTYAVNVEGTKLLLENLSPDALFIYISSDLVFDGRKGNYSEEDEPSPLSCYARSKVGAENHVLQRSNGVVVRIAKIYGPESPFHPCFVTWMRSRFEKRENVPLFKDQYRTPIYVGDVARGLEKLIRQRPRRKLYHVGGARRLSRCEFGAIYAQLFGFDTSLISPTVFESTNFVARGGDCSLNSRCFMQEFAFQPAAPAEGLLRMKEGVY